MASLGIVCTQVLTRRLILMRTAATPRYQINKYIYWYNWNIHCSLYSTNSNTKDSNGDCKVGDFGLATSSLAVVDPSDVAPMAVATFSDMTLDVGTRLYIAPEILSKRGGSRERDLSKADLYSLGVCLCGLRA